MLRQIVIRSPPVAVFCLLIDRRQRPFNAQVAGNAGLRPAGAAGHARQRIVLNAILRAALAWWAVPSPCWNAIGTRRSLSRQNVDRACHRDPGAAHLPW